MKGFNRAVFSVVAFFSMVCIASAQALPAPSPDKAQIIFMKPMSGAWGAMNTAIFDAKADGNEQLGVLDGGTKLVVEVSPGEHRFMSATMSLVHLMDAKVEAGKRYYVVARFIYGNGFQLRPVRRTGPSDFNAQSPEFPKWVSGTKVAAPSAKEVDYFVRKKDKIAKSRAMSEEIWSKKSDSQRAELTLVPEDSLP